jgi:hypothetical protein
VEYIVSRFNNDVETNDGKQFSLVSSMDNSEKESHLKNAKEV